MPKKNLTHYCSKCRKTTAVIAITESTVYCSQCFSDMRDKSDTEWTKLIAQEVKRNALEAETETSTNFNEVKLQEGTDSNGIDDTQLEESLTESFERLGLSERAAKAATKGRS